MMSAAKEKPQTGKRAIFIDAMGSVFRIDGRTAAV